MSTVQQHDTPQTIGWQPLYLSTIAGLSTCIGAAIVFLLPPSSPTSSARAVSPNMMSFSLALAGSVMVTVSVVSIIPECLAAQGGGMIDLVSIDMVQRIFSFGLGCLSYFMLSWFAFPEPDELLLQSKEAEIEMGTMTTNGAPHAGGDSETRGDAKGRGGLNSLRKRGDSSDSLEEIEKLLPAPAAIDEQGQEDDDSKSGKISSSPSKADSKNLSLSRWSSGADLESHSARKAWRVAMLLFVSLLFHNFPEGLAVAASALESPKLGITVTIGIMIHNIPEGIAIAVPCLAARPDSPWMSFALASVSGLAEPAGAAVALLFLRNLEHTNTEHTNGDVKQSEAGDQPSVLNLENVLAFVAGIMVMVALYELFPEACRHTENGKQHLYWGTICGVVIMLLTEWYLP